MRIRTIQVVTALSSFTPSLTGDTLTVSSAITAQKRNRILGIYSAASAIGVNGIYTTAGTITPVVGTTYYLKISTNYLLTGRKETYVFQATAATTTYTDLVDSLVTQYNTRNTQTALPFTIVKASSHLKVTEAPQGAQTVAGDVYATCLFTDSNATTLGTVVSTNSGGTAHVDPTGTGMQWYRVAYSPSPSASTTQLNAVNVVGTVKSDVGATYTTVKILYTDGSGGFMQDVLLLDEGALVAADKTFITSTMLHYAGLIGIDSAGSTCSITASTAGTAGAAVIPIGTRDVTLTAAASKKISMAVFPVGSILRIVADGTNNCTLIMATAEKLNAGTAAGNVTLVAGDFVVMEKLDATNWYGTAYTASTGLQHSSIASA